MCGISYFVHLFLFVCLFGCCCCFLVDALVVLIAVSFSCFPFFLSFFLGGGGGGGSAPSVFVLAKIGFSGFRSHREKKNCCERTLMYALIVRLQQEVVFVGFFY